MEQDNKQIELFMNDIIIMLQDNDEIDWSIIFKELFLEYVNNETKDEAVKKVISIYKGGIGSFADLVLHKNSKMLIEENDRLAKLKHELYVSCRKYCYNHAIDI